MASSGTFTNNFATGYSLELDWHIKSQSGNSSTVVANLYLVSSGSGYTINSNYNSSGYIKMDGGTSSFSTDSHLGNGQKRLLHSYTKTVQHNSDGTKTLGITGEFDINVTLNGRFYGSITVSGNAVLKKIDTGPSSGDPSGGKVYVGTGSVWVYGQAYVGTGSVWVAAKQIYVGAGGQWDVARVP